MNIMITGTRAMVKLPESVKRFISSQKDGNMDVLIHGGAVGIDTVAGEYAEEIGLQTMVFKPQYQNYPDRPKYAPLARNIQMLKAAEVVVGVWLPGSRGTTFTLNQALKLGKKVYYINSAAEFPRVTKLTKPL